MGNNNGCNATKSEKLCNGRLNNNLFEYYIRKEIDESTKKNEKDLVTLENIWKNYLYAPVNSQELADINCCQSIIMGDVDAKTVTFNNITNECSYDKNDKNIKNKK